jgi:hypothetical protein
MSCVFELIRLGTIPEISEPIHLGFCSSRTTPLLIPISVLLRVLQRIRLFVQKRDNLISRNWSTGLRRLGEIKLW